jgi:hypothetical protein
MRIRTKIRFYIPATSTSHRSETKVGKLNITLTVKPFQDRIQELHSKRREFAMGAVINSL